MKQYSVKPGFLWMYVGILVLMLAVAILRYSLKGVLGLEIGICIVLVLVLGWTWKRPILKLHDDHFEMKIAPGARLELVRYGDIRAVDAKSKKKLLVTVETKGARRVVKLPLSMLRADDAAAVTSFLSGKAAS